VRAQVQPARSEHDAGYEILCRKTMGFVDLPAAKDGKPIQGKVDANNLYSEHKKSWMTTTMALETGVAISRRERHDCSQCHIRNFGMHDYHDMANVDPSAGVPKAVNIRSRR